MLGRTGKQSPRPRWMRARGLNCSRTQPRFFFMAARRRRRSVTRRTCNTTRYHPTGAAAGWLLSASSSGVYSSALLQQAMSCNSNAIPHTPCAWGRFITSMRANGVHAKDCDFRHSDNDRGIDKQAGRQTDRQTEADRRQTYRQKDRQRARLNDWELLRHDASRIDSTLDVRGCVNYARAAC